MWNSWSRVFCSLEVVLSTRPILNFDKSFNRNRFVNFYFNVTKQDNKTYMPSFTWLFVSMLSRIRWSKAKTYYWIIQQIPIKGRVQKNISYGIFHNRTDLPIWPKLWNISDIYVLKKWSSIVTVLTPHPLPPKKIMENSTWKITWSQKT